MAETRLLRVLRESAKRGKPCRRIVVIAAEARLTPSEVEEAARRLEEKGLVAVYGDRVCYSGALDSHSAGQEVAGPRLRRVLSKLANRRDLVKLVMPVSGMLSYVDYLVLRRDGILFLIRIVEREPPDRLVSLARRLARKARRIAEGKESIEVKEVNSVRLIVPVLVAEYGAPRLIEGVLFKPADMLYELILNPHLELSHPLVRVYERIKRG
ncbi:hypothetical protein PYJP_18400 [Pyrofollis japonicus]|uniref:hypothetical protein n=1 Tax=Pyrofollis japonicus TaxID=3060460 RepID=UPI00295B00EA|nr:hypothetical protein [Pyrofollis japonicus]BEP18488.1 hypothetical protein PYJP_18400 [Pyrofollis japonicus]